jgi:hypothetical protein
MPLDCTKFLECNIDLADPRKRVGDSLDKFKAYTLAICTCQPLAYALRCSLT